MNELISKIKTTNIDDFPKLLQSINYTPSLAISIKKYRPDVWSKISVFSGAPTEQLYQFINGAGGYCSCGNRLPFWSFKRGYRKYCSIACSTQSKERKLLEKLSKDNFPEEKRLSISNKRKQTNLSKYGVTCNLHAPYIEQQIKKKIHDKLSESLEKIRLTNLSRYNVEWTTQRDFFKDLTQQVHKNKWKEKYYDPLLSSIKDQGFTILDDVKYKQEDYKVRHSCGKVFSTSSLVNIQCPKCKINGRSQVEKQIADFISTLFDIETNNRKLISPLELDIVIPSKNIAIEVNGVYWHRDENNIVKKIDMCKQHNIQLINIWDYEWILQKEKVKQYFIQLASEDAIYARKLQFKEVSFADAKLFCNKWHRQGWANAKYRLGLYKGSELMMILTAGANRFSKNKDIIEIIRVCSSIKVIGGFSKLLCELRKITDNKKIMTYVDRRWGSGKMYTSAGFAMLGITKPNYFYCNSKYEIKSRYECQLHNLPLLLQDKFNPNLNELENMINSGYWRCYDAGNLKLLFA